jgi:peroxiredoxin|tara:strand:+ start:575 stop:1135 length:561 start_codon:yes stop_codon:yes gene_type:complete
MQEGDRVPQIKFKVRSLGDWVEKTTDDYFKGKRVILFSLPGAFTPTCSTKQLPGFEKLADVFKQHRINEIYCMSVNDSFVMNAWAQNQKLANVQVIPDGNGEFTEKVGMLVDKKDKGFGNRSWRYAAIITDGLVEKVFIESWKKDNSAEDPYEVSSPENVLKYLQSGSPSESGGGMPTTSAESLGS